VLGLCALIVRDIYRPSKDVVRWPGDDDPARRIPGRCAERFVLRRTGWEPPVPIGVRFGLDRSLPRVIIAAQ